MTGGVAQGSESVCGAGRERGFDQIANRPRPVSDPKRVVLYGDYLRREVEEKEQATIFPDLLRLP
jgi:hypothetical protein